MNIFDEYLDLAIERNHPEIVELLLKNGADASNSTLSKWKPIHNACINGNLGIVQLLYMYGAYINSNNCPHLNTPLLFAVSSKNLALVKYLVELGADINYENNIGETALLNAFQVMSYDIVDFLLSKNVNVNCRDKVNGYTPMQYTYRYDKPEYTEKLISMGAKHEAKLF